MKDVSHLLEVAANLDNGGRVAAVQRLLKFILGQGCRNDGQDIVTAGKRGLRLGGAGRDRRDTGDDLDLMGGGEAGRNIDEAAVEQRVADT